MNVGIRLSRLSITGPIDRETPKIVLKEISDAHGITFPILMETDQNAIVHNNFLRRLRASDSRQPEIYLHNRSDSDMARIACFVNKHAEWMPDTLMEAFTILKIYMTDREQGTDCPLPSSNFPYGLQIPACTGRLNACVLFKICKAHSLAVTFDHTIDQLASAVYMMVQNETNIRTIFRLQSNLVKVENLPSLYLIACSLVELEPPLSDEEYYEDEDEQGPSDTLDYYDDVELAIQVFGDPVAVLKRVNPRTIGESIVLAAKNFKIDLSSCKAPIYEYRNLLRSQSSWVPVDPTMRKRRRLNPLSFRTDVFFNPRLPHELYNKDDLLQLALNEGYSMNNLRREGAYSLLTTSYLSPTFYHGKYPTISNTRTPISWIKIRKLSNDDIICFGVVETDLKAFTYAELAGTIFHNKNFVNPLDENNHPFPPIAIRKLKLLSKIVRVDETPEAILGRKKLARSIELGEVFTQEVNVKIRDFYLFYDNSDSESQAKIRKLLESFFRLSMFIRGWNPDRDEIYPIEVALVENQNEVDIRVTGGISDFESLCAESEIAGTIFLELPLVRYRGGWQISTSAQEGVTIRERLQILKNGEVHSDNNSCMRLTSNWFASTAYRYMVVVGVDPPFDVEKLRSIS